jgi:hypothetical protein
MLLNVKTTAQNDEPLIPQKGKFYLVKITSQNLNNGKPDKLFGGRYLAKYTGRYFLIGSLLRRRNPEQVKVISEAEIDN